MRRERERKATGVAQIRRANGRNRSRTKPFRGGGRPKPPRDHDATIGSALTHAGRSDALRSIVNDRSRRLRDRGGSGSMDPSRRAPLNDAQSAPDRRSPNARKKQHPRPAVRDAPLDTDARSSHLSTPERFRVKGVERTRPGLRAMCRWALPAGLAADDGRLHATFRLPPALQKFPPLNLEPRIRSPRPDNQRPTASLRSAFDPLLFPDGPRGKARTVGLGLTSPDSCVARIGRLTTVAGRTPERESDHWRTKRTSESHRAVSGAWRPRWRRRRGWRERGSTPARR